MITAWPGELRKIFTAKLIILCIFLLFLISFQFSTALQLSEKASGKTDKSYQSLVDDIQVLSNGKLRLVHETEKRQVILPIIPTDKPQITSESVTIKITNEVDNEAPNVYPLSRSDSYDVDSSIASTFDSIQDSLLQFFEFDEINITDYNSTTIPYGNYTFKNERLEYGKDFFFLILKAIVMIMIIVVSILGNSLVIVSVALHRRLHSPANYLLVSLATADLLVALCAMTFNASVELSGGKWLFGGIMCNLWNSFDVYFSTVSILHLCSISVDRYYAIVRPLEYPQTMTTQMLAIMLAQAWIAPTLISFLPIFLGWYTTSEHLNELATHPHKCYFQVNIVYAVLSSSVSFWVPCAVMMVMYSRIFQEARKQEHAMITRASSRCGGSGRMNGTQQDIARQQLLVALQGTPFAAVTGLQQPQEIPMKHLSDTSSNASGSTRTDSIPSSGTSQISSGGAAGNVSIWRRHSRRLSIASWGANSSVNSNTRRPMPLPPLIPPAAPLGRREHKAARTLGLIMGAFVLCWLPFFTWYVTINICGEKCHCPQSVVTILFWIGYFNSTLNPFIYVYFRADFRHAFHSTLTRMRCCRPQLPEGQFV